jgi:hypothetical protein
MMPGGVGAPPGYRRHNEPVEIAIMSSTERTIATTRKPCETKASRNGSRTRGQSSESLKRKRRRNGDSASRRSSLGSSASESQSASTSKKSSEFSRGSKGRAGPSNILPAMNTKIPAKFVLLANSMNFQPEEMAFQVLCWFSQPFTKKTVSIVIAGQAADKARRAFREAA